MKVRLTFCKNDKINLKASDGTVTEAQKELLMKSISSTKFYQNGGRLSFKWTIVALMLYSFGLRVKIDF